MTDSIRQQIIDKVDARMKAIKTTGGYKTNLGNHVFDWLGRDLATSELDALIYRDRTNEIDGDTLTQFGNRVRLEIEIKASSAATTAKTLRNGIEDVYKAIGTDETWSGLALCTQPVSDEIEIEHEDKIIGTARILVDIEYETSKWSF